MATPIRIKRSAVPGKRPQVTDLQVGELALNTYDAELVTLRDRSATGIATDVVNIGAGATVKSVIYVTKDGNDTNTGLRLGDAKATIKSAIGIATYSDVIKVSGGVYVEDNPIVIPKQVSIVGDSLREVTITPQNADKDLFHVSPGNMLQELTFSGTVNEGVSAIAFDPDKIQYNPQSPYIRFCTNRLVNSIGMKVDGSKSIGPYKSMVTDSYTQYNSNGIGVSVSNNGYAQIVSMFTMNLDTGIVALNGGQCDVTNSNSSFGNYGMISDGISLKNYTGIITTATNANADTFVLDLKTSVHSISNATYDGNTGLTTITTYTPHGLDVGMGVTLSDLGFTCSYGDYTHQFVTAGAEGTSAYVGGDYNHTFVSAAATAVATGGDYDHTFVPGSENTNAVYVDTFEGARITPTDATYDGSNGNLVLTFGSNHNLIAGTNTVGIATSSLVFTCSRDNYASEHAYPRTTDPIYGYANIAIAATTADTITVNVGASPIVNYPVNDVSYNSSTGDLIITTDSPHGLTTNIGVTTNIVIPAGTMTFTCDRDNYATAHAYPRPTDPANQKILGIAATTANTITVNVGVSTQIDFGITTATYTPNTGDLVIEVGTGHSLTQQTSHTISTAAYTPSTGILTCTINGHGFYVGDYVKFVEDSLTFTCDKDDNATEHSYPRISDPVYNKWNSISNVTANTFDVHVGTTKDLSVHYLQSSLTNGLLKANSNIGIVTTSMDFVCSKDDYATIHSYPRTTDPAHNAVLGIAATTANTITVNVGVSTHDIFPSGINGYNFDVVSVGGAKTFSTYVGPNRHPHNYVSGGSVEADIIRPYDGQVVYFDDLYSVVGKIKLTNGGSGYTSRPTVTIDSPSESWGISATAIATVIGGVITEIDIVSSGRGYTSTPNITISGGGGSSATASATLVPTYYIITESTPISSGISTIVVSENVPYAVGVGTTVPFFKQSRILASSHSFQYIGSGVDLVSSLPSRGGVAIQANEIDDRNGGLTIFTSTDQTGNFRIGDGVVINQQTGTVSGDSYTKSLFSPMTPFILALGGD